MDSPADVASAAERVKAAVASRTPNIRGELDDGLWTLARAYVAAQSRLALLPSLVEQLRVMVGNCFRCDGSSEVGTFGTHREPCPVCAEPRRVLADAERVTQTGAEGGKPC